MCLRKCVYHCQTRSSREVKKKKTTITMPAAAFLCYAESFFMVFVIVFFLSIHPYSTDPSLFHQIIVCRAGCVHCTYKELSVCMRFFHVSNNDNDSISFFSCVNSFWFGLVGEYERYDSVVRLQLYVKQHHHRIRQN